MAHTFPTRRSSDLSHGQDRGILACFFLAWLRINRRCLLLDEGLAMANTTPDENDDNVAQPARRDALKKIGLVGASATPVLLALLTSATAPPRPGGRGYRPQGCTHETEPLTANG